MILEKLSSPLFHVFVDVSGVIYERVVISHQLHQAIEVSLVNLFVKFQSHHHNIERIHPASVRFKD